MRKLSLILAICFAVISSPVVAQGTAPLPTKLFGITLGSIFEIDATKDVDSKNFPIKEFRGINRFLGQGAHFYFEPLSTNSSLPYAEKKKQDSDKYYRTSYRLYLLPIVPDKAKSITEFYESIRNWEVTAITWEEIDLKREQFAIDSKEEKDARNADYNWAFRLCKTFEAEFVIKPKTSDFINSNTYACKFTQDDRTFEVSSIYKKSLRLSFRRDIADKKDADITTSIRQLQARELLK